MAGLFGLGGIGGIGGAQPPAGLLGPYFNPADMRKQQLKQGLLAAGIGLLTGGKGSTAEVLGQGLAAGLQGANNAGINYKQDAMGYNQLSMQMEEQKAKQAEKQRLMDWVSKQPPEMQNFLAVNPEAGAKLWQEQKIKGMYAEAPKPPAGIQEYEYAKAQGFPGTFQDWEASKRGGMSLQTNPDGTITFQQGNIKPMTEAQSKDTVYATRAEGALPIIDNLGNALTSLPETMAGGVPVVGNYAKSPEFQQAQQAGLEFLQAILRKDTGAAITAEETASYGQTYLPRPGDSPEVLGQKKQSRRRALDAIKAGMPPQAILAQEKALTQGQAPAQNQAPRIRVWNPNTGKLE